MDLRVLLPNQVFLSCTVQKVVADAVNGSFCLLPRHVDFTTVLAPGLLSYFDADNNEFFLAIDEGTLVKCGPSVTVATRNAVGPGELGELKKIVEEQFEVLDEREKLARSAVARLEAGLVKRFIEFEKG